MVYSIDISIPNPLVYLYSASQHGTGSYHSWMYPMAALYRPRILIYHPLEMARMHIKLGPHATSYSR